MGACRFDLALEATWSGRKTALTDFFHANKFTEDTHSRSNFRKQIRPRPVRFFIQSGTSPHLHITSRAIHAGRIRTDVKKELGQKYRLKSLMGEVETGYQATGTCGVLRC